MVAILSGVDGLISTLRAPTVPNVENDLRSAQNVDMNYSTIWGICNEL